MFFPLFFFSGFVRVGQYETNKRKNFLGQGSFGTVYKGTRTEDGKNVALKEIFEDPNSDGQFKNKESEFLKELMKLKHENIVPIYDIIQGDSDGLNINYIVMEYCQHGDLNKCFKEQYHRVEREIVRLDLMVQFLKGVEFLHRNNMVHRDLKPANILVTDSPDHPEQLIAMISDFGSSKVLDSENSTMCSTTAVGTRLFKAPEFFGVGSIEYTRKVDSFAAGLTCLAMLQPLDDRGKLHPRIEGKLLDASAEARFTIGEIMRQYKIDDLGPVNIVELEVPENTILSNNIRKVIKDATDYDPDKRSSVEDMLEWLQDILEKSQPSENLQVIIYFAYHACTVDCSTNFGTTQLILHDKTKSHS